MTVLGFDNYRCTRTVNRHVWRLGQELEEDPAGPVRFHCAPIGYKFVP
jgi:hypothetical protein